MELSELVMWQSGKSFRPLLLAMCDYSGIVLYLYLLLNFFISFYKFSLKPFYDIQVYKISPEGQVFRRYAVADGDGNEPNPCKMEYFFLSDES